MTQRPSHKQRPLDAESLAQLLEVELACTYVLQSSSPSRPRGVRRIEPSHEALDEILRRIAVTLTQLSATCEASRDLLSKTEREAVKVITESGPRVATYDGARRILLAAVPRLFFETQALISDGREPWQPKSGEHGHLGRQRGWPTTRLRASHS